jgi:hypothetical protein
VLPYFSLELRRGTGVVLGTVIGAAKIPEPPSSPNTSCSSIRFVIPSVPGFSTKLLRQRPRVRLSVKSSPGVADPAGHETGHFLSSAESATDPRVPHPPGFPVGLGGVNEPHAAFLIESRTRYHGWGRAVGNPGSFAFFAKGGIPRISIPTVAYPTLCKERKGWGTRPFVVLPAVPNTNLGLIENLHS